MKLSAFRITALLFGTALFFAGCSRSEFSAEAFADVYTMTSIENGVIKENIVQVVSSSANIVSVESTDNTASYTFVNRFDEGNVFVSESPLTLLEDRSYGFEVSFENGEVQSLIEPYEGVMLDPVDDGVAEVVGDQIKVTWLEMPGTDAYSVVLKRITVAAGSAEKTVVPLHLSGYFDGVSYQFPYNPELFKLSGDGNLDSFVIEIYACKFEREPDDNDSNILNPNFAKFVAVSVAPVDFTPAAYPF